MLEDGKTYLILEKKPAKAAGLFMDYVSRGYKGLCISRIHPNILKKDYGVGGVRTLWLTSSACIDCIAPTALGHLTNAIVKYVTNREKIIVMLHGIEYLSIHNEFVRVVRMITYINDTIMRNGGIFLLSMDPEAFSMKELGLIKHEAHVILPMNGKEKT